MKSFYQRLSVLLLLLTANLVHAQNDTNVITGSVLPPNRDIIITQTATLLTLTVGQFANYSNVTVTASTSNGVNIVMTESNTSAVFTGTYVAPLVTNATFVTLQFIMNGLDLNFAAGPTNISGTSTVTYIIVPRPVNDNLTNAIKIPADGGTAFGSNVYASVEAGEPQPGGVASATETVWWVWSPPVNESVLIDTSGSGFPPVLGVYTGPDVADLTAVASSTNDILDGLKANVVFDAIGGETYYIQVAGYTTNSHGLVVLRVVPGGGPDTSLPFVTITTPATETITTTNVIPIAGVAKDDGPDASGIAAVYIQVNGGAQTRVFSSLGGVPTASWVALATFPAGSNSTNVVSAYSVSLSGKVSALNSIVVLYFNPINTFFSEALPLQGLAGSLSVSTVAAGVEPGQPLIAGNDGGHTVWYTFLAPSDGTLTLSTEGSTFDTLLALFTGSSLTNLTCVSSNDDASTNVTWSYLQTGVQSNVFYYIAIDGYAGASGTADLLYSFDPAYTNTPPTLFSVNVTAGVGGTAQPLGESLIANNSVLALTATASRDWAFSAWQGAGQSTNNPLVLTVTGNQSWEAIFVLTNILETFSTDSLTNLNWVTSGNAPWVVESTNVPSGNTYAVRSGVIGNSQSSTLTLVTNTLAGIGSFDLSVSSEQDWDWLYFSINGTLVNRWSGSVGWTNYQFNVSAGTNTFTWSYVKDPSISVGLDAAFVDNIYFPLPLPSTNSTTNPNAPLLTALGGSPFQIAVSGQTGVAYEIQGSIDLLNWLSIGSVGPSTNYLVFTDGQSTNLPLRFYRAVISTNQ